MRDDLLDAKASVDWTLAQLPSLRERIDAWLKLNLYVEVIDHDPDVSNNVIVGRQKEALPLFFNVEVGAYLNVLRSSLDIMATALARRYGTPRPEKTYFPVAGNAAIFSSFDFKGANFIKALPPAQRTIIESLKPYKGGNEDLWALHQLDIMRKHRKLLTVTTDNRWFQIIGAGLGGYYTPVSTGFMVVNDHETVFGLIRKGAPKCEMQFTGDVSINEAELLLRMPVVDVLYKFAHLTNFIITLFDTV